MERYYFLRKYTYMQSKDYFTLVVIRHDNT